MIKTAADQSESVIAKHPLVFITNETARLQRRYKLKVKQYVLSDEAYFYHEKLKEITGQNGTIFDEQPFTLRGNVRSIENPSEIVMGNFIVSGVSTLDIKIGESLPYDVLGIEDEYEICNKIGESIPYDYRGIDVEYLICKRFTRYLSVYPRTDIDRVFNEFLPSWGSVFIGIIWQLDELTGEDIMIGLEFADEECTTCLGSLEKPEGWD